jgi:hypothetical protein
MLSQIFLQTIRGRYLREKDVIKKYTKGRGGALDQNLGINEQLGDIASNIAPLVDTLISH